MQQVNAKCLSDGFENDFCSGGEQELHLRSVIDGDEHHMPSIQSCGRGIRLVILLLYLILHDIESTQVQD